jgi:hypothetical protein
MSCGASAHDTWWISHRVGPLSCQVSGAQRQSKACSAHAGSPPWATMTNVWPGWTEALSLVARLGNVGQLAGCLGTLSGPVSRQHAGPPDPPDHPGDYAARCGGLACRRLRWAVAPVLAGRNRSGAAQDPQADGRAARQNSTRRAERIPGVRHRRQPRAHGHAGIGDTPTHRRGAGQLPGCPAGAQRAKYRHAMRGVDREPGMPPSCGAARREAAAQEFPLDDRAPASTVLPIGTARLGG